MLQKTYFNGLHMCKSLSFNMKYDYIFLWFSGRLDKDDLNTKLGQLSRKIEEVKLEVHDAMIKKYAEFYPLLDSTRQLRDRVNVIQNDMETLASTIEKQVTFEFLFRLLIRKLNFVIVTLSLLQNLKVFRVVLSRRL